MIIMTQMTTAASFPVTAVPSASLLLALFIFPVIGGEATTGAISFPPETISFPRGRMSIAPGRDLITRECGLLVPA
jgi:hypothetical protein